MRTVVSSGVQDARRLVEHRGEHPVISLYLDLDPERFATAHARASQLHSLIDEAGRSIDRDGRLAHQDRQALRADLRRVSAFLASPEAPFKGARGLAVFCCTPDELFEAVKLTRPVQGLVAIDRAPYVEPMIAAAGRHRWLVALVSRRSARLLAGPADRLRERERVDDEIRGQHEQGGWSQSNYERSVEKDVGDHLRRVAALVGRRWRRERFDRLALGGPHEIVPRLEALLDEEPRARLAPGRVEVDLSSATDAQVQQAVEKLLTEDEKQTERDKLDRLAAGLGAGGRAAGGPQDTVLALNERRVSTLLLEPGFDRRAARCPACGLLLAEPGGACPADGAELEELEHLREAAVEAALAQDAEVLVVRYYPYLGPLGGIGALLRF